MQLFRLIWAVVAISATTVFAGKKKKASIPMSSPKSHLAALKLDQCGLVAEMKANYAEMEVPLRRYCAFFSDGKRIVRADELGVTMFISEYFCAMVPVMDGQLAELHEVDALCQAADSVVALSDVSQRAFTLAVDIQDFVNKVREAFPSIDSSCREINRANIVTMKTNDLKSVFSPKMVLRWVKIAERQTPLNFEIGMVADRVETPAEVPATEAPETTSSTEVATAAVEEIETTTEVPETTETTTVQPTSTASPVRVRTPFNIFTSDWAAVSDTDSSDDEEILDTTRAPVVARRTFARSWADESSDDEDIVTSTLAPTSTTTATTATTATTTPRVNVWQQRMEARSPIVTTTASPATYTTVAPRTTQPPTTTEGGWFRVGNKPKSHSNKSSYPKRK